MPVTLEMEATADVSQAQEGFTSLVEPINDAGEAAEKSGSGKLGGFASKLTDVGGKALALVNPVGLAVTAVTTLGPKLLEAGRAADAENTEIAQLTNTVQNAVPAWDGNTAALDQAIAAGERKAFADSDLRASLGQLVTDTGSVEEAIRLQGLAMDLAASKGIPLAAATNLVAKADDESYAALAKLGIEIDKEASREEALAAIHQSTAGAADIFANSTEGAAIRAQASMDNALESIGGAVAPGIQAALSGVADFLSGDTFQGAISFVSELFTGVLGGAFEFVQGLLGPLQGAIQPLIDSLTNLGNGTSVTSGYIDTFKNILGTISGFIVSNVVPVVSQIAQFLADNLPVAVAAASAVWNDTLMPALNTVWSFVQANVIPIFTQAATFLTDMIPGAVALAAGAWNNVLLPALNLAWTFIQNNIIPIIAQAIIFIKDNLPIALGMARDAWVNILQPALQQVWSFIQTSVIPILTQVRDWLSVNLPPALQALSDMWTGTLQPALMAAWSFIQDSLIPTLGTLISNGLDLVKGAVGFLSDAWNGTLKPALSAVSGFISGTLIPTLNNLAGLAGRIVDTVQTIGGNIIDGIIQGLRNGAQGVIDFVVNIASGAVDAIKNFFGIASPSKLMIDMFGPKGVAGGMRVGLEQGMGGVVGAADDMNQAVLGTLGKKIDPSINASLMPGGAGGTPTLASTGPIIGTLHITLIQDRKGNWRLDQQSEAQALQVRLETREVF